MNVRQFSKQMSDATAEFTDRLTTAVDDYRARVRTAAADFLGETPGEPEMPPGAADPAAGEWFSS